MQKILKVMIFACLIEVNKYEERIYSKKISKDDALKMVQKYHYSNTLPKLNPDNFCL